MVAADATELNRMELSLAAATRIATKKSVERKLAVCACPLLLCYRWFSAKSPPACMLNDALNKHIRCYRYVGAIHSA